MNRYAYIITFHDELNYGALLQAVAMSKVLESFDYKPAFLGVSLSSFSNDKKSKLLNIIINALNYAKKRNFNKFIKNEFTIVYCNESYQTLLLNTVSCDLLVCGSDQIWNPQITGGVNPYYYGIGINAKRKIAYAASCGSAKSIRIII